MTTIVLMIIFLLQLANLTGYILYPFYCKIFWKSAKHDNPFSYPWPVKRYHGKVLKNHLLFIERLISKEEKRRFKENGRELFKSYYGNRVL